MNRMPVPSQSVPAKTRDPFRLSDVIREIPDFQLGPRLVPGATSAGRSSVPRIDHGYPGTLEVTDVAHRKRRAARPAVAAI